ncbi:MAG: VTT domain-containing protein [Myxococcota bacterium]|nr:VTT domain-containing protein [Myxococcota bacterium]
MNSVTKKTMGVVTGLILLAFAANLVPFVDWMMTLVNWVRALGTPGLLIFAFIYFFAGLCMLPMLPIGILAGLSFGFWTSYATLLPAAAASAVVATFLGRHIFKQTVLNFVETKPAWRAVRSSLAGQGIRAVVLNRLAPVMPFGLQNYALGAIGIGLKEQFLGTVLGMQPALCVALYIGAATQTLAEAKTVLGQSMFEGPRLYLLCAAGLALVALTIWIGRIARRALKQA